MGLLFWVAQRFSAAIIQRLKPALAAEVRGDRSGTTLIGSLVSRGWEVRCPAAQEGRKSGYDTDSSALSVILKILPELRPALLHPTAHINIRMIMCLFVLNPIRIRYMPRQFAG